MNKICTNLEQSKRLQSLGIDIKTADMDYIPFTNNPQEYDCVINVWNNEHEKDWIPAWSLTALLKVIPKHIKDYNVFRIDIGDNDFSAWYDEIGFGVNSDLPNVTMEEPIDACYEMILKLHELKML